MRSENNKIKNEFGWKETEILNSGILKTEDIQCTYISISYLSSSIVDVLLEYSKQTHLYTAYYMYLEI